MIILCVRDQLSFNAVTVGKMVLAATITKKYIQLPEKHLISVIQIHGKYKTIKAVRSI